MNTQTNIEILEKPNLTLKPIAKIQASINALRIWHHRAKSRLALSRLDPHLLDDIGISQRQAQDELRKPFWK
jgi:uncharacterized protein YjiS (DUF1127 family)